VTTSDPLFAPERDGINLSECYFYHVTDLPGHGRVGGEWDLRGREAAYLGGVDFRGKRVLEVGTASGYLCRYMEGQGADVIGFDAAPEVGYDLVPFAHLDVDGFRPETREHIRHLINAWWLARKLFGSKARAVYGNVYAIPAEVGPVDVATVCAVLLHLRDPFHALYNALRLARETAIVTELHPTQPPESGLGSIIPPLPEPAPPGFLRRQFGTDPPTPPAPFPGTAYFLPSQWVTSLHSCMAWWSFPPDVICRMLGVLGFEDTVVTEHTQLFQGKETRMYTVVGKRTRGSVAV
jgi:hypothetical protein